MSGESRAHLSLEKWAALSVDKQILNTASELGRVKSWVVRGDRLLANQAMERSFELLDLTSEVWRKNQPVHLLRELLRLREALAASYISEDRDAHEIRFCIKSLLDLRSSTHSLDLEV